MKSITKSSFREIKNTLGRFLAIFGIVALGVGFFAGLKNTQPSMMNMEKQYIKEQNLFDYRLLSTIGYRPCDVESASLPDCVESMSLCVSQDVLLSIEDSEAAYKLHSIPAENEDGKTSVNKLLLLEGRYPENTKECLCDSKYFSKDSIGKTLKVTSNNSEDTIENLTVDEFTIVGIVQSPVYMMYTRGSTSIGSGSIRSFVYVPSESFDMDRYTEIYLTLKEKYEPYSKEYKDYIKAHEDELDSFNEAMVVNQFNELKDEAQAEIDDKNEKLLDAQKQLEDLNSMLANFGGFAGVSLQTEELEKSIEDAKAELEDAQKKLDEVEVPYFYTLDRSTNSGYYCFENDSAIVAGIADVFPVFFFLVAALVIITTMNRMVEESRTEVGVLKALGYSTREIMGKYILYSGASAGVGSVIGYFFGTKLFPLAIWTAYKMMYEIGEMPYLFSAKMLLISFAFAYVCAVGTTVLTLFSEVNDNAANLIRPKTAMKGKRILLERISFIWNKMKFLNKVSARNIFRYKKRFIMMILGISGCSALVVTGLGLNDSIAGIVDMQFDEIIARDLDVVFKDVVDENAKKLLTEKIGDSLVAETFYATESVDITKGDVTKSLNLIIPEDVDELMGFVNLETGDMRPIAYPDKGEVVITEKIASQLGIEVGETISLVDSDYRKIDVKVKALTRNYVQNYAYIDKATYVEAIGEEPEVKSAFVILSDDCNKSDVSADVAGMKPVLSVTLTDDTRDQINSMMKSMNFIVIVVVLAAAALAFIVLYNLTNINIIERTREIATLKVLGFYASETASYVFRENLILTIIGSVIGLFLGKLLHAFVMSNIVIDMVTFRTYVSTFHYGLSVVLTVAFSLVVDVFMYFKLEKIEMAQSLKSVE